jgi:hypothetical protein
MHVEDVVGGGSRRKSLEEAFEGRFLIRPLLEVFEGSPWRRHVKELLEGTFQRKLRQKASQDASREGFEGSL